MKNFSLKNILAVVLIPTLGCLSPLAYAETTTATPPANNSNSGASSNINIVGGYSSSYWTVPANTPGTSSTPGSSNSSNLYLFTQSPSFDDSIVNNLYFSNYLASLSTTNLAPTSPTVTALNSILTATGPNSTTALGTAMAQYFPLPVTLSSLTAAQATILQNMIFNYAKGQVGMAFVSNTPSPAGSSATTQVSSINSLNLGSLIDPIQYGTSNYNSQSNAQNFIMYLSNQYNPTPLIDFSSIITSSTNSSTNNLLTALGNSTVQQYLYLVREMVANYSVGMNDLYYLYNQRIPQSTNTLLGTQFQSITQSALPANLQKQASPLALEQWSATHRLTSYDPNNSTPAWLSAMENATPATLQRENLYLLAEIRAEMFKDRILQERILATLAAQQMQNAGAQQIQLQQLQSTICGSAPFSGTTACPQPSVPPASSSVTTPTPSPSS